MEELKRFWVLRYVFYPIKKGYSYVKNLGCCQRREEEEEEEEAEEGEEEELE